MGTYDPIAAKRARLQREIRQAQTELEALELVPTEDIYEDHTIIRADVLNPGKRDPLTYIFLKVQGESHRENPSGVRWYHTGFISHGHSTAQGNKPWFAGWADLQKWMAESGRVIETWAVMTTKKDVLEDVSTITRAGY